MGLNSWQSQSKELKSRQLTSRSGGGRASQGRWHTVRGPGAAHRADGKRAVGDSVRQRSQTIVMFLPIS